MNQCGCNMQGGWTGHEGNGMPSSILAFTSWALILDYVNMQIYIALKTCYKYVSASL